MPGNTYRFRSRRVFVPDGYLVVGQITSAHGLRGEVAVELHTDFPDRFQTGLTIFLGEELTPIEIAHARPHKAQVLLRFDGVDTREAAERLRGVWLFIHEEDAVELDDGAYWIHDIIGLQVVSTDGRVLGEVSDVMSTGANDVYVVQPAPGVNRDRELLLPAVADVIHNIDLEAGAMTVHLIQGLLDEDASSPVE